MARRSKRNAKTRAEAPVVEPRLHLTLYIANPSRKSVAALANLRRIVHELFHDACEVQIIDLLLNPALAKTENIVALPTLVRVRPKPTHRVLGDLSDTQKVLDGLHLKPGHHFP